MKSIFLKIIFLFAFSFTILAQTERNTGIEFYQKGDYAKAINNLNKATKVNSSDEQAWYYLGLSYLKKNDPKKAVKTLEKAVALNPNDYLFHVALAYANLLRNNIGETQKEAQKTLELNPKNFEAHYLIGAVGFRNGFYDVAYQNANKAIEINPNFAVAYLLKAESLVSSFSQQNGTIVKSKSFKSELLKEAAENLEKYVNLSPTADQTKFYREYLESVKFFAKYYFSPESPQPTNAENEAQPIDDSTQLKVLSKPKPPFTDAARQADVQGIVRLLVGFSADRTIKHILILKSLGYGLDQQAVSAARKIKFQPATKNGQPISVVKMVEYNFTLY